MIEKTFIEANGLRHHLRMKRGGDKTILFIHGNGSDSIFWEQLMETMPSEYTCIAPDLRGYGLTEAVPADATKSYGDFVDDLLGIIDHLQVKKYSVVNHSLGGGISWELLIADASRIEKMVFVNPASPFGFGGTKNTQGDLTLPEGEGSGGGVVNPEFAELVKAGERGTENPSAPANVMNAFYWEPPFVPSNFDDLLDGLLRMQVGENFYPGDHSPSSNFPFTKPGKKGQINCASPVSKIRILDKLKAITHKPKVLWVRGGKDKIVSDESLFDTAVLGKMNLIPNYPGEEVFPPQPMVTQTRFALEEMGVDYTEIVMENSGHSPYVEEPEKFYTHLENFLHE
jgi:pimeloyl-ACP methyl ester carboxylesterase